MARSHSVQTSFLTGVIDPRASARVETDSYNNALKVGKNITLHHLGGARRRPGLLYVDKMPNRLERVYLNVTVTTPNNGTGANALDDDETTLLTTNVAVGTTNPYVVVQYDLASPHNILFADVTGLISTSGSSTGFAIQYSTDGVTWTTFGSTFAAVDYQDPRTYRRRGPVTAQYWRVAKIDGVDMGGAYISLGCFNLWVETDTASAGRIIPFEVSTSDRYAVALTHRSGAVYREGVLMDYIATPYDDADLADLDAANDAENMVLVHEDYPPQFLVRETATNFQRTPVVFDNVPTFDYNDALSPVPAVDTHVITLAGTWKQGDTFQIEVDGARTGVIVYSGDATSDEQTATAANIAAAVQKLYVVKGYAGVACVRTGSGEYTVAFGGDSADDYRLMSVSPVSGSGTATVAKTTTGSTRHEAVWSANRGYPRTVTFFEGRMYFGGTKSRQQSIFGSIVGALLSFEVGEGLDDDAIFTTLRGQNLNAITGVFAGRSLQLMTTGGEFRYVKQQGQPLVPSDGPVNQTSYGSAKIRPVSIDGATLYVQRNRKSVRDFKYNYQEDAFDSLGVSALAPHLLNDIRDMFVWNGSRDDEISLVFVINGDGTIAVLNSRKEANVQAWAQWDTQGEFKAGTAVLEDMFFLVRRTVSGASGLYLERASTSAYTDCAVLATGGERTTASGLTHLNGETCRVRGDGYVMADVVPDGGTAEIEYPASVIEVGLNFTTNVTPMPVQTVTQAGGGTSNLMRRRRVTKIRARVQDTLGLLVNGRVIPDRQLDIGNFGDPVVPYTGNIEIEESSNWDYAEDKLVEFTQVDPLPLNILGLDIQMESSE